MDKARLLDELLSNTCPRTVNDDGTKLFVYDLCCGTAEITARVANKVVDYVTGDSQFGYLYTSFDIINVEWK